MLEDKDLLLRALERLIAYGESIPAGGRTIPEDAEARRMWFFDFGSIRKDSHFEKRCILPLPNVQFGGRTQTDFEEFYGLPHLNWMRDRRTEEMERFVNGSGRRRGRAATTNED